MLGKTTNGLFWMFRYFERAENTARLIETGQRIALIRLGTSDDEWRSVLQTAGVCDGFDAHHETLTKDAAIDWMLRARENPSSVLSSIDAARQNAGGPPRLFLIYPEGNFIEASADTPFFQIGEMKYGRPILVRAYDPKMSFEEAMKLLLVSFDSTQKANRTVGAPFDYHNYETGSLRADHTGRIELDDPYFKTISQGWGETLKSALQSLPSFRF